MEIIIFNKRFKLIPYFFIVFLLISLITRTTLFLYSYNDINDLNLKDLSFYLVGVFYDTITASYFLIPFIIYLILIPNIFFKSFINKILVYVTCFLGLFSLIFSIFSEFLFWEEFNARFNFIAVDYLIYTKEVIDNIYESYPIFYLIAIILILSILVNLILYKFSMYKNIFNEIKLKDRVNILLFFLFFNTITLIFVDNSNIKKYENRYITELSKNGVYSLFSAFRNNVLDYYTFYKVQDEEKVFKNLRKLLKEKNSYFINDNIYDIKRFIKNKGKEKRYNVIQITLESFSAEYLSYFGASRGKITPNLDSLVDKSLFFTNFYATGTRTVRGMESLSLSLPPTPGRSIVKRKENANMFSSGTIFRKRDYDVKFIYGGDGYFDNMNTFFGNNGFDIVDRGRRFLLGDQFNAKRFNINDDEVEFENAWGISDEDLYKRTIKEADKSFKNKKPFFSFVMTTSNHRPYTYPKNKIDIPSGTGRTGAVKYTDYALGKFLKTIEKKPWFKNTIIVIVADHCASSAGEKDLEVKEYKIPLFIYNPYIIKATKVETLMSQIDYLPTLFGLLNFSYESKFYGKDIFKIDKKDERILLGNYQKLGLIKNGWLYILAPKNTYNKYKVFSKAKKGDYFFDTITYYQSASYLYKNKLLNYED